ncbi:hypothetical protein [Agrobacterium sp. El2ro-1b]|uniref:hypothetical protein n=1 Tax=Agrobacterium sp. El2ro-1b TaxID=2969528 RepID=UPI003AABCAE2
MTRDENRRLGFPRALSSGLNGAYFSFSMGMIEAAYAAISARKEGMDMPEERLRA